MVLLLQRSPNKNYAPNFYTGIGGKIGDLPGFENETPVDSAYRELAEESENAFTKENIKLEEFARCIYESGLRLYYFYGLYPKQTIPHINPNDGTLAWVNTSELPNKDIILTTQAICEEWAKRGFRVDELFTIYVREVGQDRTVRHIKVLKITSGLN